MPPRPARRIFVEPPVEVSGAIRNRFSPQEQQKLRELYPKGSWVDILAAVPGRTRKQVISWASYQGITRETTHAQRLAATKPPKEAVKANRPQTGARVRKDEAGPATPVLNARVSARRKQEGPSAIGRMLEQMRRTPAGHPRRLAYAEAARKGNGLDAYKAWVEWKEVAGE